jgi:hypothetical protein
MSERRKELADENDDFEDAPREGFLFEVIDRFFPVEDPDTFPSWRARVRSPGVLSLPYTSISIY